MPPASAQTTDPSVSVPPASFGSSVEQMPSPPKYLALMPSCCIWRSIGPACESMPPKNTSSGPDERSSDSTSGNAVAACDTVTVPTIAAPALADASWNDFAMCLRYGVPSSTTRTRLSFRFVTE